MFDYFLRQIVYPTSNPLYQLNTKCFQFGRLSRDAQLILAGGISLAVLWWFAEAVSTDATISGRYLSVLGALFFSSLAFARAADVFYAVEAVNTIQQETVRGTVGLAAALAPACAQGCIGEVRRGATARLACRCA